MHGEKIEATSWLKNKHILADNNKRAMSDEKAASSLPDHKVSVVEVVDAANDQLMTPESQSLAECNKVTVSSLIGQFGWWQANIAAFYFIAYVLTTFNNLGISFHAAKTDYHCVQWPTTLLNESAQVFCHSL